MVIEFCNQNKIKHTEKVSHTLWDPYMIIKENNGVPPFTFKSFQVRNGISNKIEYKKCLSLYDLLDRSKPH